MFSVFSQFSNKVHNQFGCYPKILQSDGDSEFLSCDFQKSLSKKGISHQISCPYTPEQNGSAEHKHWHIIELGLAMMFDFGTPKQFWLEAFSSVVFLINRLPTAHLKFLTPVQLLFGKDPDYSMF